MTNPLPTKSLGSMIRCTRTNAGGRRVRSVPVHSQSYYESHESRRRWTTHFSGPTRIGLSYGRRSKIEQAVSLAFARRTGIWHSYGADDSRSEPPMVRQKSPGCSTRNSAFGYLPGGIGKVSFQRIESYCCTMKTFCQVRHHLSDVCTAVLALPKLVIRSPMLMRQKSSGMQPLRSVAHGGI